MDEALAVVERRPLRRRKMWVWLVVIVVLATTISVSVWFFAIRSNGPIPRKYTRGLQFTLYYPTRLPDGYQVDRTSFANKDGSLIFNISSPGGRQIGVSEQALSSGMPTHQKTTAPINIPGQRDFDTPIGHAYLSFWGSNYVADITTEQTWIILNVSGLKADEATQLAQSFSSAK